jgi:drug/metabolite transporter (DMT)-like permease
MTAMPDTEPAAPTPRHRLRDFVFTGKYVFAFASAYAIYQTFCAPAGALAVDFLIFLSVAFVTVAWQARAQDGGMLKVFLFYGLGRRGALLAWASAVSFVAAFALVLNGVSTVNTVAVLVILSLQPALELLLGARFIRSERAKIASRGFLLAGLFVTLFGALLYRGISPAQPLASRDDLLSFLAVGLFAFSYVARTYLAQEARIIGSPAHFFGPTFFMGAVGTLGLITVSGQTQALMQVEPSRFLALVYLGAVPTAWANLGIQKSTQLYGVSFTKCVESLRPLFGHVVLLLLAPLLHGHMLPWLSPREYAGLAIVLLGAFVAARLGLVRQGR